MLHVRNYAWVHFFVYVGLNLKGIHLVVAAINKLLPRPALPMFPSQPAGQAVEPTQLKVELPKVELCLKVAVTLTKVEH